MRTQKREQNGSSGLSVGAAAPAERNTPIPTRTPASSRTKSEQLLKEISRKTKRIFSAEQKIIIVMEGIRGEVSIAELCRQYGITETTYYKWNKEFIEAGKKRLAGDELRQATSSEVEELRRENKKLNQIRTFQREAFRL